MLSDGEHHAADTTWNFLGNRDRIHCLRLHPHAKADSDKASGQPGEAAGVSAQGWPLMWGAAASGPGKSPSPCYAVVIEQRSGVQRQDFWHQLLALSRDT